MLHLGQNTIHSFTLFLNIHDVNKCYIIKTINTVQWDVAGRVNE